MNDTIRPKDRDEGEWYLPSNNEEEVLGPFSTSVVERKLAASELRPDQFIWSNDLGKNKWVRICEVKAFFHFFQEYPSLPLPKKKSKGIFSQIKKFQFSTQKKGEYGQENQYRRFPRVQFSSLALVHNDKVLVKARCIDISEKGLSIQVDNSELFREGETLSITITDSPVADVFSVYGVIVRKFTRETNGLGIYFTLIKPQVKRRIARFVIQQLQREDSSASGPRADAA